MERAVENEEKLLFPPLRSCDTPFLTPHVLTLGSNHEEMSYE